MRDLEAPIRDSPDFKQFCLADKETVLSTGPRGVGVMNPTSTQVACASDAMRSPLDLVYYYSGYAKNDLETIT